MSKTIQAYIDRHPDKFESWHTEDNNERGCDYWIYCKDPYYSPEMEGQSIHEDTVKDALFYMRRVIKGRRVTYPIEGVSYNGHYWEPAE